MSKIAGILFIAGCLVLSVSTASSLTIRTTHTEHELQRWQHRQGRTLLHAGIDHGSQAAAADHATAVPAASSETSGRSYRWLKWVAGAVLLVEGLLGVLLPVALKLTVHATWALTLVNCFAGGVFFSFGVLHLLPDALDAQNTVGLDRFPLAAFLVALAFMALLFLHRVLAPALNLKPHLHRNYIAAQLPASLENGVGACGRCGDDCGCAGGVGAGNCGQACQAGSCTCVHRKKGDDEISSNLEDGDVHAASFGATATSLAAAAAPPRAPDQSTRAVRAAALVPPLLILLGILCHTVLEGLAIGLQRSYGDVVSAFVAMAAHKWVESIAVATAFLAAGCGMVAVWAFLVPFSLGPLVGIAIGVSVDNSSTWAIMVLFSLVSGLFIYVGSVGIVSEEFAKYDDEAFSATMPRGARFYMFAVLFFGFVVVALLQLVPE